MATNLIGFQKVLDKTATILFKTEYHWKTECHWKTKQFFSRIYFHDIGPSLNRQLIEWHNYSIIKPVTKT